MPMIDALGFTGSSDGGMPTPSQKAAIKRFIDKHRPMHVHHGDCINSDKYFHEVAQEWHDAFKVPIIHVHPPTIDKKRAFCVGDVNYNAAPYLKRNRHIVSMSDALLATPHGPEEVRSGTWATIRYARKKGIPIYIIYPSGRVVAETGNAPGAALSGKIPLDSSRPGE